MNHICKEQSNFDFEAVDGLKRRFFFKTEIELFEQSYIYITQPDIAD